MRRTPWLLALLLSAPARAQSADELRAEVAQRVAQNNWQAADRAYGALVEATRPTARDHYLGGQAARALGRINEARARFEAAIRADPDPPDYALALEELLQGYGEVVLKVPGRHAGGVPLRPETPPVDALHRRVIDQAKKELADRHKYAGLLPVGRYTLGEAAFEVRGDQKARARLR